MARPKNLQTKGYFSVIDTGHGNYALVFKGKYTVMKGTSRQGLYTRRLKYSSWLSKIVALLKATNTELREVD